jgi:short-subunit dehydrogenase
LEDAVQESFRGITALVTGSSRGLGEAFALDLVRRGAHVILVARSESDLRRVAARAREVNADSNVEIIAGDLSSLEGAERIVHELHARGLVVDLLINNAGAGSAGAFLDRPLDAQLASVQLNIGGILAMSHLLGSDMRARGSGGIINVASTVAFQPMPYMASYAATKAFVLSFTEALVEELKDAGVHVMVAHPGSMSTNFYDGTSTRRDPRADSPDAVATQTLDDYARVRTASYPGRPMNRVLTWVARFLPRSSVARATADLGRRQKMHEVTDVG